MPRITLFDAARELTDAHPPISVYKIFQLELIRRITLAVYLTTRTFKQNAKTVVSCISMSFYGFLSMLTPFDLFVSLSSKFKSQKVLESRILLPELKSC